MKLIKPKTKKAADKAKSSSDHNGPRMVEKPKRKRTLRVLISDLCAADGLNGDLDVLITENIIGIMCNPVSERAVWEIPQIKDMLDIDLRSGASGDLFLVHFENLGSSRTYYTESKDGDIRSHICTSVYSLLNISHFLTPASFAISFMMSSTVPNMETVSIEIDISASPLIGMFWFIVRILA